MRNIMKSEYGDTTIDHFPAIAEKGICNLNFLVTCTRTI